MHNVTSQTNTRGYLLMAAVGAVTQVVYIGFGAPVWVGVLLFVVTVVAAFRLLPEGRRLLGWLSSVVAAIVTSALIAIVAPTAFADLEPSPLDMAFTSDWTTDTLAASLLDAGTDVGTDLEQSAHWVDTDCTTTSQTETDGTGFYVCSYRQTGDPQHYLTTIEATTDAWRSSGAAYPLDADDSVFDLTGAEVEAFLTDPADWWLARQ